ncbi:hypothetical protein [Avibacterium paragallinarum]|uniref:Uncharacterized protein n=2 Tax=Avibacterium paragallinarum TaxID=728 RepID=A0A0F5ETK6_AVIPA|nr:hypothetical protein [Avibacterium paragallinarum]AZI14543.1 hypothetical protein EIA51_07930 [Avibacterium paragallinarum]POY47465.1 hypothetical protein C3364_01825 [Avibacterium paragallinarum]QIR11124.1 hypothetical protein HBL79_02035 [Avibacterium paragallinarum]QJE10056.1 hypothetical protein HHJ62_06990 [Avibacterium paragallinarum]QJE12250.1 hypothetical protein HHJ61_06995 [Avibacterium paragallinarum]
MTEIEYINPQKGKYILLEYSKSSGWDIVRETRYGLPLDEIKQVHAYQIKYRDISPKNLLIVPVED